MAGGVVDGQSVSASVTNAAFITKNGDDSTPSNLGLSSTNPAYGSSVTSVQRELNAHASVLGLSLNQVYNYLFAWASDIVGSANDTVKARVEAIVAKFVGATGHKHSGSDGDGAKIPASSIDPGSATTGQVITYDGTSVAFADASGGGGGGGGSLQWIEADASPTPVTEYQSQVYAFQSGLSQSLWALIKVPSSYSAGKQIKLKIPFYSPDSSGTALIQASGILIRTGTDVMGTGANSHTSSNSALTLSAGTVNIPQSLDLDLTDSSGQINSVGVSAGDLIKIQLTRGSDTATSDLKVPVYGAEVTFQ